jgi:hypothetical protein
MQSDAINCNALKFELGRECRHSSRFFISPFLMEKFPSKILDEFSVIYLAKNTHM